MTRHDWLARYRRLFAIIMERGVDGWHDDEAVAIRLPLAGINNPADFVLEEEEESPWKGLGKRGQEEVLKLGERLYQEVIR